MANQFPTILWRKRNTHIAFWPMLICFSVLPAGTGIPTAPPGNMTGEQSGFRETSASRELAEKVSRLLDDLLAHSHRREGGVTKEEKIVRLSEKEVNAYVQHQILTQGRPGVQSAQVRFLGHNQIGVSAVVDFDALPLGNSGMAMRAVRALLSGKREVYVEGTLSSRAGTAQFSLDKAYIGGLRIPAMVLTQMHDLMARLNAGKQLSEPRPLPYGLRSVEVTKEALVLRC